MKVRHLATGKNPVQYGAVGGSAKQMELPKKKVLFLSHAAADEEIAIHLRKVLEQAFADLKVFVSSDPEDLPPGDPWVQTVLSHLGEAFAVWVLATERGLSRKWVWFEAGAGWNRPGAFVPCCLGKIRKGGLPAPYSQYQAVTLDEKEDLESVFASAAKQLGFSVPKMDYAALAMELVRLDVRAEERNKLRSSPFAAQASARVVEGMKKLGKHEIEALRQLLIEGELVL